jgi:hypothetical protein
MLFNVHNILCWYERRWAFKKKGFAFLKINIQIEQIKGYVLINNRKNKMGVGDFLLGLMFT